MGLFGGEGIVEKGDDGCGKERVVEGGGLFEGKGEIERRGGGGVIGKGGL